ncbi:DUF1428 family protein [bacterium]|nr:MAG: DUF1428 family protein [bacterium]
MGELKMAKYVDGFVLVVPKGKEADYQKMAEDGRDSWMKHGALQWRTNAGAKTSNNKKWATKNHRPLPIWLVPIAMKTSGFSFVYSARPF